MTSEMNFTVSPSLSRATATIHVTDHNMTLTADPVKLNPKDKVASRRSATLCWRQRHESTLSTSISAPKLIGYEIRHLLPCCIPLQLYLCAVSCPPPPAIHFDPISGLSSATPPQHMAFNLLLRPGIWKSSSHFRQPWTLRFFCRSAVRSWDLLSSPHSIKSQPRHSLASQWKFRKWLITSRCSPLCTLSLSAHDDAKCHTVDAPWHFNILHLNPICILNVQPPLFSSSYAPRVCDLMALQSAHINNRVEMKWHYYYSFTSVAAVVSVQLNLSGTSMKLPWNTKCTEAQP